MPESKKYVVTEPFTISYENGKQTVSVDAGDVIVFDGFNFSFGDVSGMSASLKTVVKAGEWVSLIDDGSDGSDGGDAAPVLHQKPMVSPTRTYNATGGVQMEMSDPAQDINLYRGRNEGAAVQEPSDDLGKLVEQYEKQTEKNGATVMTSDMADIRTEVTRPAPKVIIQDVREVAKVQDTKTQTSSGAVTAPQAKEAKRPVVHGQKMAKQTAPTPAPDNYKHLKVDSRATGTVVSKVTDRSDATMNKRVAGDKTRKVVQHQSVAKTTSRPTSTRTDVGSSTQAGVERQADSSPEVMVVSTVQDEFVTASKDGIKSTMTVRASDEMSDGAVTSTSSDGVELADNGDLDVADLLRD